MTDPTSRPPSPDSGAALQSARASFDAGDLDAAERIARPVASRHPGQAGAHLLLAQVAFARGRHADALSAANRALAADASNHSARIVAARAAYALGRRAEAQEFFERILREDSGNVEARVGLCELFAQEGRAGDAVAQALAVTRITPADARAWTLLGSVLSRLGRRDEALSPLERATELDPRFAAAQHLRAAVCLSLGRYAESERASRAALAVVPDSVDSGAILASALIAQGRAGEAEPMLRSMLGARPDIAMLHFDLAQVLMLAGRFDEALPYAFNAIKLNRASPDAHALAGTLLAHLARFGEAVTALDAAASLAPEVARFQVLRALVMPVIPDSAEQIAQRRADLESRVNRLAEGSLALAYPPSEIGQTSFYLAYHGLDDAPLQRAIARMYAKLCPSLAWRSPHADAVSRQGRRLRVCFISAHLRDHTIGKLMRGIIERIDRSRFEILVAHAGAYGDAVATAIDAAADEVISVPGTLEAAREALSSRRPDVLFYPDVGMDPFTTFLAYSRIAPVQVTTWGHPDTTGIPAIDYFLSSTLIEPPVAQPHYTERLAMIGRMPVYHLPVVQPADTGLRARLGIEPGARLYACPQSLFKLHPDFDAVLGRILEADRSGVLVFVANRFDTWNAALVERMRRTMSGATDRVRFVGHLPEPEFLELLAISEAVLDPPTFSGGLSSYQALAVGAPVVTLPGQFMRGRLTLGLYRQMNFEALVARDVDHYVELAVSLASDTEFREKMRAAVRQGSALLVRDDRAVREIETFLERAFDESLDGSRDS